MENTLTPPLKEKTQAHVEKYHQYNYWQLFPAGKVQPWVFDAFELIAQ
jgi:hypothetical protein